MKKRDELQFGCMAKAAEDEMTFVLLGRDRAAPVAIRAWIAERLRIGKNKIDDPQIAEAEQCAKAMEGVHSYHTDIRQVLANAIIKDIEGVHSYHMDIRQVLANAIIKDIEAREDKILNAVLAKLTESNPQPEGME
jgi:hypothetical protein